MCTLCNRTSVRVHYEHADLLAPPPPLNIKSTSDVGNGIYHLPILYLAHSTSFTEPAFNLYTDRF